MYRGEVIIVDNRLLGRFDSNIIHKVRPSRFRLVSIVKTKIKAMFLDWFVYGSDKAIYFKVFKKEAV